VSPGWLSQMSAGQREDPYRGERSAEKKGI